MCYKIFNSNTTKLKAPIKNESRLEPNKDNTFLVAEVVQYHSCNQKLIIHRCTHQHGKERKLKIQQNVKLNFPEDINYSCV